MARYLGRALLLAILGGIATYFSWMLLAALIWMPYWHQLAHYGMYFHDVEGAFLVFFGSIVLGIIFLAVGSAVSYVEARRIRHVQPSLHAAWLVLAFAVLPALVTFFLISGPIPRVWRFPLSETAVLMVGLALACAWTIWRRW